MIKISKHKLLSVTVILMLILICSAYSYLTPTAHASPSTSQQKGVTILDNVVGLDLSQYMLASNTYQQSSSSFMGIASQESIEYHLVSQGSRLNVFCTFANGNLQMLQVLDNVGSPILAKPVTADTGGAAKNFLNNYQTYTAGSIYGQLESTLNNIDASKNLTKTSGNTKLEVSAISNGYTNFKWTYTINGIIAPTKFVALGFNNNSLSYFVDNWQLYTIGSTKVTISKNDAEAIALNTAKAHSWSVPLDNDTFSANNFNESNIAFAALLFDHSNYTDATHNGAPLMLYPVWRVGVQLNKWYGDLYGIEVDMYADNGQVISAQEALSTLHPQDDVNATANVSTAGTSQISNLNTAQTVNTQASVAAEINLTLIMWLMFLTSAGIIGTASVWMMKKKSQSYEIRRLRPRLTINKIKSSHFGNLLKRHNPVTAGILICIMLLPSLMFFTSIPTVKATPPTGTAVIWGAESIGQLYWQTQPYNYWRKQYAEIAIQDSLANFIGTIFSNEGWSGPNGGSPDQQGNPGSFYQNIEGDLLSLQQSNAVNVAVVDFDHGVGTASYSIDPGVFHYMFEDETGTILGNYDNQHSAPWNAVYDNDVYSRVNSNEISFAFISTCLSADYYNAYHFLDNDYYYQYYGITQGPLPDGTARGMPYAFTHRWVEPLGTPGFDIASDISSDGYNTPDAGSQVYIGFPIGSPSLSQWIPDPDTAGWLYGNWVPNFFSALVDYHMTVHNALDYASEVLWGTNFFGSCLSPYGTGFQPYWYIQGHGNDWPTSWMGVFGNGNIQLPSPQYRTLSVNAVGVYYYYVYGYWVAYYHEVYPPNVYIDGINYGPAPVSIQVATGSSHTVAVDSSTWDPYFNCYATLSIIIDENWNWYANGASIPINYNRELYALYYP